ncbi:DNA repair protein RecN [Heliorestis acidaminivorans]|uniref:DNA repair protein RecN n=1 Tax=Heliorestis acidaminivorans TaxID=553427 RepID=A0A6I0ESA6_9FIRM|nr:DNA repair protein RecN [Heliorestis acidaminivorans]KAB2951691.1 DNA repair protein RecN [Heliorestis acidaminivorans]
MLERLRVENFALIEEVELELSPGLNLLTGETGAGKSLLIDAVGLLIGGRSTQEALRSGANKARIEGFFTLDFEKEGKLCADLAELGVEVEEDGSLLLSREIAKSGKNVCRINGRTVPLALFREVGGRLIDLQGQHEQQSLMNPRKHGQLLDRLSGQEGESKLATVAETYKKLQSLEQELARLQRSERERIQRLDMLKFQIKEIGEVHLMVNEDEALEQERKKLQNMEKLIYSSNEAYDALYGEKGQGVLELLDKARLALDDVTAYDSRLQELSKVLEETYYQAEDVAERLRDYREDLEYQPGRLDEVQERLSKIDRLKHKYGATIEEILTYNEAIIKELDDLERCDETIEALEKERQQWLEQYYKEAALLTEVRHQKAKELEEALQKELSFLGMARASLEVQFRQREGPSPLGMEEIEFLFAPNVGEPAKALARIASGGELGRILLAFKTILARYEGIPSLIFDEIDAGIGGQALQAVAQKMAQVAEDVQIICVTHAPQLAAYADNHFLIRKDVTADRTVTNIKALSEEERIAELTRMLGGDKASEATVQHAQEMYCSSRRS